MNLKTLARTSTTKARRVGPVTAKVGFTTAARIAAVCIPKSISCVKLATERGDIPSALVKTPGAFDAYIKMSPFTRQMLYAVDYASFVEQILIPDLAVNTILLVDRCSAISSVVYGQAEGVDTARLEKLYDNIEAPSANIVFIFDLPAQTSIDRMKSTREPGDYFDNKPPEFKTALHDAYKSLAYGGVDTKIAQKTVRIDATDHPDQIVKTIFDHIARDLGFIEPRPAANVLAENQGSVKLEAMLMHPDAKIPWRSRSTDAGYDLFSIEDTILHPITSTMVATGIKLACPPGYYYTIEGRSSMWSKGIEPSRGIIDSTYCGDLYVSLTNWGRDAYQIKSGDRIAQILLHRQHDADIQIVQEFGPLYNQRGQAGFGSTGK
jgi:dUTP pyrophosphatase